MSIQNSPQTTRKGPNTNPGDYDMATNQTRHEQTGLEAFTAREFPKPEPKQSTRPDELETPDAPAQTTLTGAAEWTDDQLATFYDRGLFPAQIAAELAGDLSRATVADRLRRAGVLEPWDDYQRLERLYCDEGWSTERIAAEACDGRVSAETVAQRLHLFGLAEETSQERLAKLDADALDLSIDAGETDREPERVRV